MSEARQVEAPEWLSLSSGEIVHFRAGPSKNLLLAGIGAGMLLMILVSVVVAAIGDIATGRALSFLAVVIVVATLVGIYTLVHRWEYALTSDQVCVATGSLSREQRSVPVANIEEVRVTQSWWQRPVNVGDLLFVTHERTLRFAFVEAPYRVQERVLTTMGPA